MGKEIKTDRTGQGELAPFHGGHKGGGVDDSTGLEQSPHIKMLAIVARNTLLNKDAVIVVYPKLIGGRKRPRQGEERFITVDSQDGEVQINIHSFSDKHKQQYDEDTVLVSWADEAKRESGIVQFTKIFGRYRVRAEKHHRPPAYHEWLNTGGLEGILPGIFPMSPDEIEKLTEQLDTAHPNLEMTQAALRYLEKYHMASKIEDAELSTESPRKELEQ